MMLPYNSRGLNLSAKSLMFLPCYRLSDKMALDMKVHIKQRQIIEDVSTVSGQCVTRVAVAIC